MRNLKKVLSLSLALVMLIGMMVVGAGAAKFDDVPDGADKQEAVEVMNAINIIKGDGDGDFRPTDTLNRAEAAVIISKVLFTPAVVEKLVGMDTTFTDMAGYEWAIPYVQACANRQVINGTGDNKFEPARKVTGIEFAAMLMRVLGVDDTKFTNWDFEVQQKAIEMKLDTNGVVISAADLSRQDAAQMAFNAITKYSPSGSVGYIVDGGTPATSVVFGSMMEAMLYQANQGAGNKGTIKEAPGTDTLAATRFNLSSATGSDDFGRTTKVWSVNGQKAVEVATNIPVLTYTTAVTEKQVFADLGVTGRRESGDYYVVMDEIWYDGKQVATAEKKTSGSVEWYEAKSNSTLCQESVIVAKNTSGLLVGSGNGVTVEIYSTGEANHYKMVIVNEYVATISGVTKATATTDRKVNFTGITTATGVMPRNFTTEEFEKGDVVLYTVAGTEVATMKLADKVEEAKVTSYKTDSATLNGNVYTFNSRFTPAWNFRTEYTLYLDSCGNIILANGPVAGPVTTFAYIVDAVAKATQPTAGNPATVSMDVQAVLADGSVGIYNVNIFKAANGDYHIGAVTGSFNADTSTALVWDNDDAGKDYDKADANVKGKVFGYTLSPDGKTMTLSAPQATSGSMDITGNNMSFAGVLSGNFTTGSTVASNSATALINKDTKFVIIKEEAGKAPVATVYTGSVPVTGTGLVAENTTVVMTAVGATSTATTASSGVANIIFSTSAGNVSGIVSTGVYAYVDASTEVASNVNNKTVYSYTATTNGEDEITVTSSGHRTSGVYVIGEDNVITAEGRQTEAAATVLGGMISTDGTNWLNLTDDTVTVNLTEAESANGMMCVVFPAGATGAAAKDAGIVFIVRAKSDAKALTAATAGYVATANVANTAATAITLTRGTGADANKWTGTTALANLANTNTLVLGFTVSEGAEVTGVAIAKTGNVAIASTATKQTTGTNNGKWTAAVSTSAEADNKITATVTVTAEDASTATYTIEITVTAT